MLIRYDLKWKSCTLLLGILITVSGCHSRHDKRSDYQTRFDSCYQFVRQHSLDHRSQADTIEQVLLEMIEADSLLLSEKQRRQQVSVYRTLSGLYLTRGKHDLMLSYMIEGERKASQLNDQNQILSYSVGLLTLYSSWRLKEQAHYYIDRCIQQLPQIEDTLVRCDALMTLSLIHI